MTTTAQASHPRRLLLSIAGSLLIGLLLAVFLVAGPLAGGSEPTITGSVLLAFAIGWGIMGWSSIRFTEQPQRWAYVPAIGMGLVGMGLLAFQPSEAVVSVLSWIWPAALLVLVAWMVIQVRAALHSRARRWLLYPVFGVLVLFAVGGASGAFIAAGDRAPMAGQLVDVGGHRLHIECIGSGSPTVVLESGAAESSFYWARIAPVIATTTKVCVYDRAGRGWSEAATGPQDGLAVARDLHTLLSRSGNAGPYVLVGHSTGGAYVRIFAASYPEVVAGMVLLDSQPADAFTSLPDYSAFYASTHTLMALLPSVARLGVFRLAYASAFMDLPGSARQEERADQGSVRVQVSQRDEFAQIPATLREAGAFTGFGNRPLVVISAGSGAQRGWLAAQDTVARLSTNSAHRVLPDMEHMALITSESGAATSSLAVLDVVAAVRSGGMLTP